MKLQSKNNFVTIFPWYEKVHFYKCTGQIPYHFSSELGFSSYIVSYAPVDLGEEHLKTIVIPKRTVFKIDFGIIWFLLRHSKKINWLYQYHFFTGSFYVVALYGVLYKLCNRHGILFSRFEADLNFVPDNYPENVTNNKFFSFLHKAIYKAYFRKLDVFGVLDFPDFSKLKEKKNLYQQLSGKVVQQLNGYSKTLTDQYAEKLKSFAQRDNIVVTFIRIEDPLKGLEVALKASEIINFRDWQWYILGTNDQIILKQAAEQIEKKSNSCGHVKVLPYVADKAEYYNLLNRAKLFVLPSFMDGMPLVVADAMAMGCVLISADHHGCKVATRNGEFGYLFETGNHQALAKILNQVFAGELPLEEMQQKSLAFAHQNFSWNAIVNEINSFISK